MAEASQSYSLDSWITVLCFTILTYLIYSIVQRKVSNLPPGPWGLPLIGYAPFVRGLPFRHISGLRKKYGHVLTLNIFGTNIIVLNSYEAIRECFVTKAESFSGRVVNKYSFFSYIFEGRGFIQEEGPTLQEYRRFSLHTLRDFGFGKLSLESRVQEIGGDLIRGLANTRGKPYDPMTLLSNAPFNVILYLTTDKHFEPDDPDFRMIRRNIRSILTRVVGLTVFTGTFRTRLLPMEWHPDFKLFSKVKTEFYGFSGRIIKEHEDTFQENNLRDYIDAYLAQRYSELREGKDTVFTIDRLKVIVMNLLVAGSETTSNSVHWALRLIVSRPDIQAKLQRELDEVVGKDRLPSILDKPNLPYMEAFILELLRHVTIAPLGIPHSNPVTATLYGYTIPARSIIVANLWGVHNDPEFWEEPDKFDPDRFLDPATKAKRRERVMPFSTGKRSCLGEALARMEIFLFLTMLLQKFTFKLHGEEEGIIREKKSFIRILEPYEICAVPRTA